MVKAVQILLLSRALGSADVCDVTFDVVQVQDTTNSFSEVVEYMKGNMSSLVNSIQFKYPTSRYGLTSFADKCLPWLGWGWGGSDGLVQKDSCYELQLPLTSNTQLIQEKIKNIKISGGNDSEENAFDALLQTVVRPSVGWRTETFDDFKAVIRVAVVVTDAPSHVAGDGTKWVNRWNKSWGMDDSMNPDRDFFPTGYPAQFSYHEKCTNEIQAAYKVLGPLIRAGTVPPDQSLLAQKVIDNCGPVHFPELKFHSGGVTSNLDCISVDYPSVAQVVEQMRAHQVHPIVLIPEDTNTGSLPWYQWLGYCKEATTETDCVVEYYVREFSKFPELNYVVAKMTDAEQLEGMIKQKLEILKSELCEKFFPDQWPTVESITTVTPKDNKTCVINFESKCGACEEVGGAWGLTDGLWVCSVDGEPIATVNYNCAVDGIECCTNAVNSGGFGGVLNHNAVAECLYGTTTTPVVPGSEKRLLPITNEVSQTTARATCEVTFDVMQVQDTTNSFKDVVNYMKGNMSSLVDSILSEYPTSRYGLTSFADKTLPWLGWGWGDVKWDLIKDSCYEMQQPLTTDTHLIQQRIQNIKISGGNDSEENAFDALLQTVVRPSVGWRTETFDDFKAVIRVAVVVTDAPSHVAGDGTKWVNRWNKSWGMDDSMNPDRDFFPTGYPAQFSYHEKCTNEIQAAYKVLGPLIRAGTVPPDQSLLAQKVIDYCGPVSFPKLKFHSGGVTSNLDCTGMEYPSVAQVVEQMRAHNVHPIVLIPEDTNTGALAWYQWLGYCKEARTETDCVVEYYVREFSKFPELNYVVAKMTDAEQLEGMIKQKLEILKSELCEKFFPDQWPTVESITTVTPKDNKPCVINFESKCGSCEEVGGVWELTDGLWVCYADGEPIATVNYNCAVDEIECCTNAVNSGGFGGVLNHYAVAECLHTTEQPTTFRAAVEEDALGAPTTTTTEEPTVSSSTTASKACCGGLEDRVNLIEERLEAIGL